MSEDNKQVLEEQEVQDATKRNEEAAKKQAETRREKELNAIQLFNQNHPHLTKRNEEYLFKLEKELKDRNYDSNKTKIAIQTVYEEMLDNQKQQRTATKEYGTVAKKADEIINGKKEAEGPQEDPKLWEMALDNGLLMFIMFNVLYGVMAMFTPKSLAYNSGWMTTVAISVITGVGMAFFYKAFSPNAPKQGRIWRSTLAIVGLVVVWMAVFALLSMLPKGVNSVLNPITYFILAVIGFAVRYFLKKYLNIRRMPF